MHMVEGSVTPMQPREDSRSKRLSYKFQRLRERLRAAIDSGELSGKLPGERELAKRFRINAKTLSKALTDLAAEGLLERSIGRGTFVRGSAPAEPAPSTARWLLLADDAQQPTALGEAIRLANSETRVLGAGASVRPSELAGVRVLVDLSTGSTAQVVRDALLRGIVVVSVNKSPQGYSTHCVHVDRQSAAANIAREMLLMGHRSLMVVEPTELHGELHDTVRQIAQRYDRGATVHCGGEGDVRAAIDQGATAVIFATRCSAEAVTAQLRSAGISVPERVSIAACGMAFDDVPCDGYFVRPQQVIEAIGKLAAAPAGTRPTTLWLAGDHYERGTTSAPPQATPGNLPTDRAMPLAS